MILRALRSTLVKLCRPVVLTAVLGASAAFAILATVVTLTSAGDGQQTGPPGAGGGVTLADLARPDGIVAGLGQAGQFLGVVALALGAWIAASEYQHGTVRNLLVRQPRRLVLLSGTALAAAALLLAAAAAATVASVGAALLVVGSTSVDSGAWTAGEVLKGFGRMSADLFGYGLFGGVLGLLLRSPVAAIGAGVAYALPVETVLRAVSSATEDVLPGRLLAAVAEGSASAANLAVLGAWVAAGSALAAWSFLRRDIA